MTKIGHRIALLRKQNNCSQSELAQKIEASREAIGKYERNEAQPSVETAKKIADVFDVTLDYLVEEGASSSFDKKTVKRLKDIELLDEKSREHVFALLDAFIERRKIHGLLQ